MTNAMGLDLTGTHGEIYQPHRENKCEHLL